MICKGDFETCQCHVTIYETDQVFFNEKVYCIVSLHHNNGKKVIRFGTADQIRQICNTYKVDWVAK